MKERDAQIKHPEMVRVLAKKGELILEGMTPASVHNLHMAVGIAGEIAELVEAFELGKDRANKLEELGDIEFYMEGLAQGADVPRGPLNFAIPSSERRTIEQAIGSLVTAGGEILDICKKESIYGQELNRKALHITMMTVDLALHVVRQREGFSHQDTLDANIEKLAKRYHNFQYSDAAAKERADKA